MRKYNYRNAWYNLVQQFIPVSGKGNAVPLQVWTGPQGSRISWHRHMKVVGCQPYASAAFNPRINLVLIFRGWVDLRAHGTIRCHGKTPATPGIDSGTFRLVAQCLNHYATPRVKNQDIIKRKRVGSTCPRFQYLFPSMCSYFHLNLLKNYPYFRVPYPSTKTVRTEKSFKTSPIIGKKNIFQKTFKFIINVCTMWCGARGGVVVKALHYKPAGRGFDSRWCHWNFSVT
jgi:hypothetical protein